MKTSLIYRSKAPLRIGLAGGGTDVSPYSDIYGGAILNATINLYAYATIIPREDGKIKLISQDRNEETDEVCSQNSRLVYREDGSVLLH